MTKVSALPTLGTIDRTADSIIVTDASASNATTKMVINDALGFTGGNPVSTSDTQTLTNKTLGITNTITVLDTLLTLQDNADNTKQAKFELSSISTGTTRTYTLPNVSDTLVTLTATQTLTNKTLTSPVINTATIANPTITVDTVSEYTSANGVTIDGVKLKDGALATNNSVVTANITDAAVTPAKLLAGTGSSWAWQSFTPSWTASTSNPAIGNGTITGKYMQIGKTVFARYTVTYGSTTTFGAGNYRLTYPISSVTWSAAEDLMGIGLGHYLRNGVANYIIHGYARTAVSSYFEMAVQASAGGAGTYPAWSNFTQAVPATSANGDSFRIQITYEAA